MSHKEKNMFKPGINHIEIWVSDLRKSKFFYKNLFELIGWKNIDPEGWSNGSLEIYLREEKSTSRILSLGVHHICFQATSKAQVDKLAKWLKTQKVKIFNGPIEMRDYTKGYYTVDFYDPDGLILEFAYTPNMKL